MKPLKFVLLGIFSFTFFSCSDEIPLTPTDSNKQLLILTPEPLDFFGKEHNNALDSIFQNVINTNKSVNYRKINDYCINYVFNINNNTKKTPDDPNNLTSLEHINALKDIIENSEKMSFNQMLQSRNLTLNQQKYVSLIKNEIKDTRNTFDIIIKNILEIEKQALLELNENEIIYILGMTSISKDSIEYWNTEKGEKWFKKYNVKFIPIGTHNLIQSQIDWHNVAVADLVAFGYGFPSGVTTGMVAGGLALGVSTAGIGAGIGAVLGGFVGGSATGLASAVTASAITAAAEGIVSIWLE
ncbi:hypothetical protein [Algoriphagus sp.]|uniref:hypothetical protein n=1 Tax=Algoriphagus sp. TaxID=1872435 RepID=UPI0032681FC6